MLKKKEDIILPLILEHSGFKNIPHVEYSQEDRVNMRNSEIESCTAIYDKSINIVSPNLIIVKLELEDVNYNAYLEFYFPNDSTYPSELPLLIFKLETNDIPSTIIRDINFKLWEEISRYCGEMIIFPAISFIHDYGGQELQKYLREEEKIKKQEEEKYKEVKIVQPQNVQKNYDRTMEKVKEDRMKEEAYEAVKEARIAYLLRLKDEGRKG